MLERLLHSTAAMRTAFLATAACVFFSLTLHAADPLPSPPPPEDARLPGVGLAEFVSQTTGVAVSPLLGVCGIGVWKWFNTPAELRDSLPWYCSPWAWGTGWTLLALCFLKDFLGTAAPPLVKKPLDFLELFENKASAIVASTAFLPLLMVAAAHVDAIQPQPTTSMTPPAALGLAVVQAPAVTDSSWSQLALYVPLGLIIFAVVWLSCHALNVLIALSPFGIVDAGLKLAKLVLISVITGVSMIHPLLGLAVCVPLIVIATLVSGWAFRMTVFGTIFGWDFLTGRKAREEDVSEGVKSFNARKLGAVPPRTWGELRTDDAGAQVFRYRPWLVLPRREAVVEGRVDGLTKGLLHPTMTRQDEAGKAQSAFILPPRYRACVQEISRRFGIQDIADSTLLRGLKAMRHWLVEMLSVGKNLVERGVAQGQRALR